MGTKDVFIFELSQSSFTASAVENSYKLPVIVEFMGVWSEPCIRLADSLSVLAREFAGQFIFAKVDVDEQPELSQQYGIENVPSLLVLKDGKVINTLDGLVKESELRELLKSLGIYNQSDELRLQAREKHLAGYTVEAIQLLTQAIQQDPANSRVAMDMVQVMIDIGELEQATGLFNRLPDSEKESEFGRALIGQLSFMELASKTAG
ncbi:MAG: thioredoxin domain-containing protein, partial [Gammaproteobacteria bacterium]|nr:thioredoxin domain-containing protein [Gammaproteobacteria bacterium]